MSSHKSVSLALCLACFSCTRNETKAPSKPTPAPTALPATIKSELASNDPDVPENLADGTHVIYMCDKETEERAASAEISVVISAGKPFSVSGTYTNCRKGIAGEKCLAVLSWPSRVTLRKESTGQYSFSFPDGANFSTPAGGIIGFDFSRMTLSPEKITFDTGDWFSEVSGYCGFVNSGILDYLVANPETP